jgi:hypothetical protein
MAHDTVRPRWRPRVPLEPIRRLYQADAMGLPDDELAGKVGYALYERCLSMIQASKAVGGEVGCPGCRTTILHDKRDDSLLTCDQCGWRMPWKDYYKTIRKKKLAAPGILPVLQAYAEAFPGCRSYREKMVEIDRLIHTFHAQSCKCPTSPIAKNVLEGNIQEIVVFLDDLAYSPNTTPELLAMREAYKVILARSWAGGRSMPKDWREPFEAGE